MVIVPVLCGPVWAATEKFTTPLPEPLAPELIVIQASLLAAVHEQPVAVVTLTLPAPPEAGKLWLVGLMVNEQPLACVTVNVWPATVIVPVRCGPVLAATVNWTVPAPEPLAPAVMVIHESLLAAVQAHPVAAVTLTDPDPPLAGKLCEAGLMVNAQPLFCVTVKVCPATVIAPMRCGPVLAATVNWTVPLPLPLAPLEMVIQAALLVAVHAQIAAAVTLTEADPPLAVKV